MDKFIDNFFFFKSGQIYMENAEYAKTKEKSIFRFLVFEIWPFLYSKLVNFQLILNNFFFFIIGQIYMKDARDAESNKKSIFRFSFLELWSIFYSKFTRNMTNFEYKNGHISKTQNCKYREKLIFHSAHFASFM